MARGIMSSESSMEGKVILQSGGVREVPRKPNKLFFAWWRKKRGRIEYCRK
jgi:hypothetical protein